MTKDDASDSLANTRDRSASGSVRKFQPNHADDSMFTEPSPPAIRLVPGYAVLAIAEMASARVAANAATTPPMPTPIAASVAIAARRRTRWVHVGDPHSAPSAQRPRTMMAGTWNGG